MNWTKARATAREAVIFMLLGPVAIVAYLVALEAYEAPPMATYQQVKACLFSVDDGGSVYLNKDDYLRNSLGDPEVIQTLPCGYEGKFVEAILDRDIGYVATLNDKQNYYVRLHNGDWVTFPVKDLPQKWGYATVRRTINQTPLSEYIHLKDAALRAAIFGWPLGFGVWFFYRLIRFAVKG